jgi:hypothetical protein
MISQTSYSVNQEFHWNLLHSDNGMEVLNKNVDTHLAIKVKKTMTV